MAVMSQKVGGNGFHLPEIKLILAGISFALTACLYKTQQRLPRIRRDDF